MTEPAARATAERPPIICPGCGGANDADAVFCVNARCGKALGEFRYVLEEIDRERSRIEKLAHHVARLSGRPHFVTLHLVWFGAWILINSGLLAAFTVFDEYPFGLLGIILAVEATLITLFLLISNNEQSAHAEKRAALDYEVNVRTWRLVNKLDDRLENLVARLERLESGRDTAGPPR
jgi:uncharacterized membrane protein